MRGDAALRGEHLGADRAWIRPLAGVNPRVLGDLALREVQTEQPYGLFAPVWLH